jgi:hypothetical protein
MSGKRVAAVAAAAALVIATRAEAAGEPTTFASSRLGTLTVTSKIQLDAKTADMRGVWNDTKVGCTVNRVVKVRVQLEYIPPSGRSKRVVRRGSFRDVNCAEGGPNVGFTITARKAGFACPNGAWRPARYSFVVRTIEPTRQLQSVVSLDWFKTARCGS